MADPEIIKKLTGLVFFDQVRIDGLEGEGKEKVVLKGTILADGRRVVVALYRSNPMFLLNEVSFEFLPASADPAAALDRHLTIFEKLLTACEEDAPSLFFWHMKYVYARILVGLCLDFEEYNAAVLDTTTMILQNREFVELGKQTLNRKASVGFLELDDWEMYLKEQSLSEVVSFVTDGMTGSGIDFNLPTALLSLIFCESFFGDIPKETEKQPARNSLFGDLTSDNPPHVQAEDQLRAFLADTEFATLVPSAVTELAQLRKLLDSLRAILLTDDVDDVARLKRQGEDFIMRYNAGRNTLLRGLPRFIRVFQSHLARVGFNIT